MKRFFVHVIIGSVIGLCPAANAQGQSGTITGIVCDATRAVIPGALAVIRNQESDTSQTVEVGPTGEFVASDLAPGKYTVEIRMPCFHTSSQPNIQVSPGSNNQLKIRLEFCGVKHLTKETKNFSTRAERQAKTELEKDLISVAERIPCSTREGSASAYGKPAPNCPGFAAMQFYFDLVSRSKTGGLAGAGGGSVLARAYYGASTEFNEGEKHWLVKLRLEYTMAPGNSCGEGVFLNRWVFFDEEKNIVRVDDHPPCDCDSGI